ncbi:cytochrome-c oxidase, cbb3-type subunit II [uncultured Roseobacter sp.]|uniref:cytochrome-c oxidase, cbb3-type subunit II n=1 Tax=uncultured Roseobacter sp. TaxID=114847 RepID=UPI002632FBFE|nr:cytochrome-c oxidase, cbb3-type subunit II [uncultured Roseobacter sp.]
MDGKHAKLERNGIAFAMMILFVASLGGIFEIAPLFTIENTVEEAPGMRPYSPLELAGRDIYVREGCYACHSQMIRTLKSDVDRYGHYSLAAESMYDHPHQWGSKRTGPDLARIGQKYSDAWHVAHLKAPREFVQGSVMPGYPFLSETPLDTKPLPASLRALQRAGVPYTDAQIEAAVRDAAAQADVDVDFEDELRESYGENVQVRDFDGQPDRLTEMDALVAYLQMLGTLVDFDQIKTEEIAR